jgi:short/branched chain acyl-CoA dehydrogenase
MKCYKALTRSSRSRGYAIQHVRMCMPSIIRNDIMRRCPVKATQSIFSTVRNHHNEAEGISVPQFPPPITLLTQDETMIQDSVRAWANNELKPMVRQMEKEEQISPTIIHKLFQNGFMALEIPQEHNGLAFNFTSACIAIQEISRIDPSVGVMVDVHNTLVVNAIRSWASPFLQSKYLPQLATDTIAAFCLSEPNAGSDAFSMTTTAIPSADESHYTINGTKSWITSAKEAGLLLVFCNADPSKGYKGITAFLVDVNTPGVHIGKRESKLGLKASSTCQITFDNVRVDSDHILGEVGQGYKYCIGILNEGRIGIAAQQIGIAKGCFDIVLPYLHERKQFGQKLADMPALQQQYAQAATELHAAEVMMYNACRLKENGMGFVKEACMVKLYASQVAERISSQSIEWLGGIGFTTDLGVEKLYRDCKVGSIYEGSSNMQRLTIAKMMNAEYE